MKTNIIDLSGFNNHFSLKDNENQSYILINPQGDFSFELGNASHLKLAIVNKGNNEALIKGNVGHNSELEVYYADFAEGSNHIRTDINLVGENSSLNWHLASLAKNNGKKTYEVSVSHNALGSKSQINNYGVCKDEAKLNFSGIVHIHNGAHGSVAHQTAKIIIFDDNTDAVAKPILKIDDNDIEASHASSVGKISDDELFYLTSRGLSSEKARELITFGYLKPIIKGFENDEVAEELAKEVEEGF